MSRQTSVAFGVFVGDGIPMILISKGSEIPACVSRGITVDLGDADSDDEPTEARVSLFFYEGEGVPKSYEDTVSLGMLAIRLPNGCTDPNVRVFMELEDYSGAPDCGLLRTTLKHSGNKESTVRLPVSTKPRDMSEADGSAWQAIRLEEPPQEESWLGIRAWLRDLRWPDFMYRWLGPRS